MTIEELLQSASIPKNISPNPALDAILLLAKVTKKSKEFILAHPEKKLTANQTKTFQKLIARRQKSEPMAYLLGEQEFYGLAFKVSPAVLIPRPETELIVDEIINTEKNPNSKFQIPNSSIIDVGTGSGCIIISLAKLLADKNIKFFGLDISPKALTIAKTNAKKILDTGIRRHDPVVKFVKSDLLKALVSPTNDLRLTTNDSTVIIANLPYLTAAQIKNSPSIKYEPRLALAGGRDGLVLYKKLLEQIAEIKKTKPQTSFTVYLEIDPRQTKLISAMIKKILPAGKIEIKKDLSGKNRLVIIDL